MRDGVIIKVATLGAGAELASADLAWWREAGETARLHAVDAARLDWAKLQGGTPAMTEQPDPNRDFEDLLRLLREKSARYLVIGGYAVSFHATPRFTKDLDVFIEPSIENAERVIAALAAFIGTPDLSPSRLASPNTIIMIGVPPNRVDVLTGIDGITFAEAWPNRVEGTYGETKVPFIGLADLIRAKRASGRPQDLIDAELLERVAEAGESGAD